MAALEDPTLPLASLKWLNRHSAVITARMEKGQILSVQISYHPGWKATVGGEPRRVYRDNLGQLVIDPACRGACTVEIHYGGWIPRQSWPLNCSLYAMNASGNQSCIPAAAHLLGTHNWL